MVVSKRIQKHSFHLVDPSPWPLVSSFSAFMLTFGGVMRMHGYDEESFLLQFGLLMVLSMMFCWWRDVTRESTFEGRHTFSVQCGIKVGMLLFIASEFMFFFAFFWAFFHSSFNPSPALGGMWPPSFLLTLDPWKIPLLNTFLLLTSGGSVTWAHHSIISGFKGQGCFSLLLTVLLAIIFTLLQWFEYISASFSISDGVYGSSFFMATGFHGFHVIVGTLFLVVCSFRLYFGHFTREHHLGFEAAAWYWHFVDVVWLFLFITIYWWGS